MHRLFVAIELPDTIKADIFAIREEISGARWVSPSQIHLTLRFIGEVDDQTVESVRASLATIQSPPFQLAMSGIGHFPPRKEPRILWAGMQGDGNLLLLQKKVECAVQHAGIPGETRPFAPHITIARLKGTPPETVKAFEKRHDAFLSPPFQVASFYLFRSIFSAQAVSHEKLAQYFLS
ncbi:MAG TPA: RNA 2',3'-cyclic phosphodiesterase [Geobacteraceae bacterium]|nr:RNA 2',3'-cyclic phosphodiesterase [Geobacteraceae bacterium]